MSIAVSCECGKAMRVNDSLAGKRVKCPACGAILKVPSTADASIAKRPAKAVPQKGGNNVVLNSVVGVALLAALGIGAYFAFFSGSGSTPHKTNVAKNPDKKAPVKEREKVEHPTNTKTPMGGDLSLLDMVPADTFAFVQIRIGEFLATASGKKALEAVPAERIREVFGKFGIAPADLKEIVAVLPVAPIDPDAADKAFLLISSEKPIDIAKFEAAEGVTKKVMGGRPIHVVTEKKENKTFAIHFITPRKAMIGQESAFTVAGIPRTDGPLSGLISEGKANRQLLFAGFRLPSDIAKDAPPFAARAQRGTVIVADEKLKFTLKLTYADAVQAVEAKNAFDELLKADLALPPVLGELPVAVIRKGWPNVKASVKGVHLVASMQIDSTIGDLVGPAEPK